MPYSELTPAAIMPKSGIVVFPTMTAPASFSRAAGGESNGGVGQVRVGGAAVAPRHADRVHAVLDGDRQTVQRTQRRAARPIAAPTASAAAAAPSAST